MVSTACAHILFAALRAAAHVADSLARLRYAPPSVYLPRCARLRIFIWPRLADSAAPWQTPYLERTSRTRLLAPLVSSLRLRLR